MCVGLYSAGSFDEKGGDGHGILGAKYHLRQALYHHGNVQLLYMSGHSKFVIQLGGSWTAFNDEQLSSSEA